MEAKLKILRGADAGEIDLFLPFLIGRSADAALKIPHESVSREHCRIYEFDGELAVRDLGSRNGTLVNGQRIDKPTFLAPGDELTVGGVTFQADYQIRRQVIVTPHHKSSSSGEPTANTESNAETVSSARPRMPQLTEKDSSSESATQQQERSASKARAKATHAAKARRSKNTKARKTEPVDEMNGEAAGIPVLGRPVPVVADVPVLDVSENRKPIEEEIQLDTEAPVELVREDDLQGFLDELDEPHGHL